MSRTFTDKSDIPAPPEEVRIPLQAIRGRGAATALAHRFALDVREAADDGWGQLPGGNDAGDDASAAPAATRQVHGGNDPRGEAHRRGD